MPVEPNPLCRSSSTTALARRPVPRSGSSAPNAASASSASRPTETSSSRHCERPASGAAPRWRSATRSRVGMTVSTGVFGGTFDPPHVGHVALARRGIERFGLDRLLVRVVADPGHREVGPPAEIRLGLAELAFSSLDEAVVARSPRPHGRLAASAGARRTGVSGRRRRVRVVPGLEGAGAGARARTARRGDPAGNSRASAWTPCSCGSKRRASVSFLRLEPHDVSSSDSRPRRRESHQRARAAGGRAELTRLGPYRTRHDVNDGRSWLTETSERKDTTDLTSLEQARRIAALCEEKLATDVAILDMRSVCDYTDYFVIATGQQRPPGEGHPRRGARGAQARASLLPRSVSGLPEATWIVDDYLDVVMHVFTPETREYYRPRGPLERRAQARSRRDRLTGPAGASPRRREVSRGSVPGSSQTPARGSEAADVTTLGAAPFSASYDDVVRSVLYSENVELSTDQKGAIAGIGDRPRGDQARHRRPQASSRTATATTSSSISDGRLAPRPVQMGAPPRRGRRRPGVFHSPYPPAGLPAALLHRVRDRCDWRRTVTTSADASIRRGTALARLVVRVLLRMRPEPQQPGAGRELGPKTSRSSG